MMKKTAIRTAALASALLVCGTHAMADGRTDYYYQFSQQRYFDLPQNAESFGMAGTTVTTLSDSSSVLGNPAGLGFMKDADVSATYAYNQLSGNDLDTYEDIEQTGHSGHALAALPVGPTLDGTPLYGNIGFGWSGYRGDSNDAADTDTDGYRLHLSYGNDISSNLSLGYGVSYLHDNWEEQYTGDKVEMDDGVRQVVGLQYKSSDVSTWGLTAGYGMGTQNYTVSGAESDNDISSLTFGLGHSHTFGATTLAGAVDYANYEGDVTDDFYSWGARIGVEQKISDSFRARAGYRYAANFDYDITGDEDNAKYNAVSLGASLALYRSLRADYGAEYRWVGQGDWTHLVSLSMPFSLCVDDK